MGGGGRVSHAGRAEVDTSVHADRMLESTSSERAMRRRGGCDGGGPLDLQRLEARLGLLVQRSVRRVQVGVEHAAHVVDRAQVREERDEVRQLGVVAARRIKGASGCEGEGPQEREAGTHGSLNQLLIGTALFGWKT